VLFKPDQLLADCRCVACFSGDLEWPASTRTDGNRAEAISCVSCGTTYDVVDGIPYLLVIERRDFLALIEIAAEYDRLDYSTKNAVPFDGTWRKRLAAYDQSTDREQILATLSPGARKDLVDRHQQWAEMQRLSGHLDLAEKNVLVLGAGLGFDAHLLADRGAHITAVDLNPQTNSIGKVQLPAARWIGALGRRLPFTDGSFDYVFISASLHHVLDVSATIVEMLRVLKCGGSLVTSNDSFVADSMTDEEDARFWNDHVAVLNGINENRPRLKSFIDPLLARRDVLDVDFWTSEAWDVWCHKEQVYKNYLAPTRWDLWTDHSALRESSGGGLFMRVTPKSPVGHEREPITSSIARPNQIASWIGNKTNAMAEIARLTPEEYMPPRFPGKTGNTKFQLLNGWRWTKPGEFGREAYHCGRWFLAKQNAETVLEAIVVATGTCDLTVQIVVDGAVKIYEPLSRDNPASFAVDISDLPSGKTFCVEIRTVENNLSLDQGSFRVERLEVTKKVASDQKMGLMYNELARLRVEMAARDQVIAKLSERLAARDGFVVRLMASEWWLGSRSKIRGFLKKIYLFRRAARLLREW
jgi:SAM-dependent methyltransferase